MVLVSLLELSRDRLSESVNSKIDERSGKMAQTVLDLWNWTFTPLVLALLLWIVGLVVAARLFSKGAIVVAAGPSAASGGWLDRQIEGEDALGAISTAQLSLTAALDQVNERVPIYTAEIEKAALDGDVRAVREGANKAAAEYESLSATLDKQRPEFRQAIESMTTNLMPLARRGAMIETVENMLFAQRSMGFARASARRLRKQCRWLRRQNRTRELNVASDALNSSLKNLDRDYRDIIRTLRRARWWTLPYTWLRLGGN